MPKEIIHINHDDMSDCI